MISPRRVTARRLVRFRVRTTVTRNGRTRPVARARVHFAGKLFRTNRQGRAQIKAVLRKTGRREGRASHSGLRKGYAWIYVRRR